MLNETFSVIFKHCDLCSSSWNRQQLSPRVSSSSATRDLYDLCFKKFLFNKIIFKDEKNLFFQFFYIHRYLKFSPDQKRISPLYATSRFDWIEGLRYATYHEIQIDVALESSIAYPITNCKYLCDQEKKCQDLQCIERFW